MSVALVVVSHSAALADAVVALAREMAPADRVRIEVAAGTDDGGIGTDTTAIMAALEACGQDDAGDGVLVLLDLGSAVLSAETALDLVDPDLAERVVLSPAPLVEGLVVAAVAAAGGAPLEAVAREAAGALTAKTVHLDTAGTAPDDPDTPGDRAHPAPTEAAGDAVTDRFVVEDAHGLHARPAAALVTEVVSHDAVVTLRNLTTGSEAQPGDSMLHVALLGAEQGATVEVSATGPEARAAVAAVVALAAGGFADDD